MNNKIGFSVKILFKSCIFVTKIGTYYKYLLQITIVKFICIQRFITTRKLSVLLLTSVLNNDSKSIDFSIFNTHMHFHRN